MEAKGVRTNAHRPPSKSQSSSPPSLPPSTRTSPPAARLATAVEGRSARGERAAQEGLSRRAADGAVRPALAEYGGLTPSLSEVGVLNVANWVVSLVDANAKQKGKAKVHAARILFLVLERTLKRQLSRELFRLDALRHTRPPPTSRGDDAALPVADGAPGLCAAANLSQAAGGAECSQSSQAPSRGSASSRAGDDEPTFQAAALNKRLESIFASATWGSVGGTRSLSNAQQPKSGEARGRSDVQLRETHVSAIRG